MSKYNPVSSEDTSSPSLNDDIDHDGAIRYRDDPPEYDDSDEEQQYDNEDYNDEEIAIQSMELQAATVAPSRCGSSNKRRFFSILTVFVVLVGIVVGGKMYTDQNGVPENIGGLVERMKGQWEDWTGGRNSDTGEEDAHPDDVEINELIEADESEFDEERDEDMTSEEEETVEETEQSEEADTNQEASNEEVAVVESTEEEETNDEADQTDEQSAQSEESETNKETLSGEVIESTEDQEEEEVHDEAVEEEKEEEVVEDLPEDAEISKGDNVPEDNDALNYLVGATGTISKEWSVIEQVPHDQSSFT